MYMCGCMCGNVCVCCVHALFNNNSLGPMVHVGWGGEYTSWTLSLPSTQYTGSLQFTLFPHSWVSFLLYHTHNTRTHTHTHAHAHTRTHTHTHTHTHTQQFEVLLSKDPDVGFSIAGGRDTGIACKPRGKVSPNTTLKTMHHTSTWA